jgi:phosphomannomutase
VRPEESWFSLRPSNTEPLLRVMGEAATDDGACALAERVRALVDAWLAER